MEHRALVFHAELCFFEMTEVVDLMLMGWENLRVRVHDRVSYA